MMSLIDMLQCLNVDPLVTCNVAPSVCRNPTRFLKLKGDIERQASLVGAATGQIPSFMELYRRGRIVEMSHGRQRDLNINGLSALGLRTNRPDGVPWAFNRASDLQRARLIVERDQPTWIIGSPHVLRSAASN